MLQMSNTGVPEKRRRKAIPKRTMLENVSELK